MNGLNRQRLSKLPGCMVIGIAFLAWSAWGCFAAAVQTPGDGLRMRIFDGKPRTIVVNGYSTSFKWPAMLQAKLDEFTDGKRILTVKPATKGGTPIAGWMDIETGEPKKPWLDVLKPRIQEGDEPVIVLAQQSLQWCFGQRTEGIRDANDTERIKRGGDILEKYVNLLKEDGAGVVFVAMHIYKHPMEPEIGNERLALAELLKRKIPNVYAGPDVWKPTKARYPEAFAADKLHPNDQGAEIMARKWFETLLRNDLPDPQPPRRPGETTTAYLKRAITETNTGQSATQDRAERKMSTTRRPGETRARYEERMSRQGNAVRRGLSPVGRLLTSERTYKDVQYVPNGHERNKLDIYLPEQSDGLSLPLIIWVHGGAWLAGSKENCPAKRFVAKGYAVASINYRLSQHAIFPAQIEDCKAAVRYLRANSEKYGFDPNRFGAWGASAGGHLVALLGTTGDVKEFEKGPNPDVSSRVQAICDYFGPTDFTKMSSFWSVMKHDAPDSPEAKLIGGAVQENKDKCKRANPITYVTKDDPPFLIVHGDKDPLVPHNQSETLLEALQKAGVKANLHIVPGGGHGGFKDPAIDEMVDEFFAKTLKSDAKSH